MEVYVGTKFRTVFTRREPLSSAGLEEFLEWYDGVTREQLEAAEEIRSATTV